MPQTLTRDCLSQQDQQVLESVFNPLELTSALTPSASDADLVDIVEWEEEGKPPSEATARAKALELEAIELAESGDLSAALARFQNALSACPTPHPSVYNNRAQALRFAGKDDDAFADLNKAIELSTAKLLKTKCHALCQRGVLHRKHENLEAARSDFEEAAKLGSNFAKTQLIEINPFAALCNQMLRQAFDQLK